MKCARAVFLVCVLAVPAQAQYQWPYQPWPGFEQPQPRQHVRSRPRAKPAITYRTKTVTVVKRETWREMSQDRAREWLKDQAEAFCQRYVNDAACQRPAVKEQ